MPLLSFWMSDREGVGKLRIEQIVATAGQGDLRDGSDCSEELRRYFSEATSSKLAEYVDGCLTRPFNNSGFVLQDLANELGRRLEYKVSNGRYRGVTNGIGYDGIWASPEGHSIVVETKSTDAYRISLDTIAEYRGKLTKQGDVGDSSSVLIVVGREDTGELEAQIRGSRHAWDMRLISVDALIKLVQLKEDAEDPEIGEKIRNLLAPKEYTRLDELIDVVFTTAKDVEKTITRDVPDSDQPPSESQEKVKGVWKFTEGAALEAKRQAMVVALGNRERVSLIKRSRASYWDGSHTVRAIFAVSKRYRRAGAAYWFAYHPDWDQFLGDGERSFFVLGGMDTNRAYAIPRDIVRSQLDALNVTEREDGKIYWHIHLHEDETGRVTLALPKQRSAVDLSAFQLQLDG